jgi:hypothetical protein
MPAAYPVPTIEPTPAPPQNIYLGDPAGISAFAAKQTDAANTFLLQLGTLAASLTPPVITPVFPSGPAVPPQLTAARPELQTIVWTSPSIPATFTEALTIDDLMPAPFDDEPPVLSFPIAPASFTDVVPAAPGIDTSYTDPGLTVTLPTPPDLLSLNTITFGGLTLPTIDPDAVPTLDIVAPSIREYVPGAQYTSSLLSAVKVSLEDTIVNGGTGLDANVENAIWDRGREREAKSRSDALKDLDRMEEMGFALPPGVYVDARIKITTESDYVNRGTSREIMIKQAELAYQATKDRLEIASSLEGKCMDYSNAVEQRLFEATKYATEAGIAIFNARVQAYAAYLDAYKTKIQIYEAQVRAQLALVDVYKAQIEAESVKATINTSLVESYKAQVEASLSAVEIYKARIEGIRIKAEIEKVKVDIYGAQVQAYGAKINAYTAGVEGYRASIQAEGAKQEVYRSEVEAFSARVGAAAKEIDARIAAYRGRLDAYTALWEGYKAQLSGEASKAQAVSSYNQSLSTEYAAEVQAVTSYNETLAKEWQATIDQAQQVARIGIEAAKANAEMYITTRSLATDAAKVGAQVSAQLGAAALNAINWSQSVGTSVSTSNSTSFSASLSASQSENYNYNYSESVSASV